MGIKKQDQARQRRAASVEYRVTCYGAYGLLLEDEQFLSTSILHVNGPGELAYHVINPRFIADLCVALDYPSFSKMVHLGGYTHMFIDRVNDDGTLRPVLSWYKTEAWREFECWKHDDCTLFYIGGLL